MSMTTLRSCICNYSVSASDLGPSRLCSVIDGCRAGYRQGAGRGLGQPHRKSYSTSPAHPCRTSIVTVTSPALQVSNVTAATDQDGNYQVLDLPAPGVYKVSFARAGFQTFVRTDLNLSCRLRSPRRRCHEGRAGGANGRSDWIQPGCRYGEHLWRHNLTDGRKLNSHRKDWAFRNCFPCPPESACRGSRMSATATWRLAVQLSPTESFRSHTFRWKVSMSPVPTILIRLCISIPCH